MKKVAILQSNYIPWKGYFDLIAAVDEFILYDDAYHDRRGKRKRVPVVEQLMRDVPTDINAQTDMVRFTTDVVPPEVEYVLGQIRAYA